MSEAYLGEVRMFSGNYAPVGWALCNGQTLSISENEALFALIGTTYGGDGQTTFALPDLQGRIPIHKSPQYALGSKGGTETVTLTQAQLPAHTHLLNANNNPNDASQSPPTNHVWGVSDLDNYQTDAASNIVQMNASLITLVGGNLPHNNIMPSMAINFIIATEGLFPTQQ
ncbi:phage tail protein [Lysinibacillus sp. NPDC096418]|uniref:phage tail protein n=1 Tax=Lysinibacillus sp. NPDC096418 TaxID=3364138 RepID=UPI00382B94A3